ncbi:hypothetical protein GCM10020001_037280 [Nonomuraea salmonea]
MSFPPAGKGWERTYSSLTVSKPARCVSEEREMAAEGDDPGRAAWKEFARRQRRFRRGRGLSQERLASLLPYSESAVGHVERLMRKPTGDYTRAVEKALGLDGELMELVPVIQGHTMAPKWFREWPRVEMSAHTIRTWEPMLIPGLLQTEDYATQVFLGEPGVAEAGMRQAVRFRMHRQTVFARPPPAALLGPHRRERPAPPGRRAGGHAGAAGQDPRRPAAPRTSRCGSCRSQQG